MSTIVDAATAVVTMGQLEVTMAAVFQVANMGHKHCQSSNGGVTCDNVCTEMNVLSLASRACGR